MVRFRGGNVMYQSGFLPPVYQATVLRDEGAPIQNLMPLLTRAQFEVPPNPPATLSPMIAARSTDRWWPYEVIARTTASVVNRKITGSIPVGPCIWPLASPPEPDPPFRCVERLIARRAAASRRCQERNNRAARAGSPLRDSPERFRGYTRAATPRLIRLQNQLLLSGNRNTTGSAAPRRVARSNCLKPEPLAHRIEVVKKTTYQVERTDYCG